MKFLKNIATAVVKELNLYNTIPFDRHAQRLGDCKSCQDQLLFSGIEVDRKKGIVEIGFYCDNCGKEYHDVYTNKHTLEYIDELICAEREKLDKEDK